jgi:hypothetical protein
MATRTSLRRRRSLFGRPRDLFVRDAIAPPDTSPTSRAARFPARRHHRPDVSGNASAAWDPRPLDAGGRLPGEAGGDSDGVSAAAGGADAARGAASVAARRRSGSERTLRANRRGASCDGVRSAPLPPEATPVAAEEDAAAGHHVAIAAGRHAAAVAGGHPVRVPAAVAGVSPRAAEGDHRLPRGVRPSFPSAARTPEPSAAYTCGSGRPGGPASRRKRNTGSVSNPRDRSSCRSCKGCFSAAAW